MRILILHSRYLSGPASGENRVVEDESRLLSEAGHHVDLWDPSMDEATSSLGLVKRGAEAIWSRTATRTLRRLVADHDPDLIHYHNLFPMLSPAVVRESANLGKPSVMTLHNYRLLCLPGTFLRDGGICEDCLGRVPWPGVVHRCYRASALGSTAYASSLTLHRAMRSFDAVHTYLAVSAFIRDKYVEAGFDRDRIRVKANFSWSSQRRDGPGEYFLYLGRLSSEKGVNFLLEMWARTRADLVVVGDGPEAGRLKASAPANVHFTGQLSADEVPAILTRARALVVPSLWQEPAGRVILEAYAAGVPVVASTMGGLPEVVEDDMSGILVPPTEVEAWTNAVARLSEDDESERLARGAYLQWARKHSPEKALRDLVEIYETVLTTHH